jgi:hypothetical protein
VGAVRELHRLGTTHVVAVGASLGGAAVLAAGPELTRIVLAWLRRHLTA